MTKLVRRPAVSVVVAIVVALSMQQPALAATTDVSIFDFGFNPGTAKAKPGGEVKWANSGQTHTVTNTGCSGTGGTGPGLFCSNNIPSSGTFSATFAVAGSYSYFCKIHPSMQGTVSVAMTVRPSSGSTSTEFTVTWAKGSIPSGFDADIQIQRPGSSGFSDFRTNQTGGQTSATFVADAGPGEYKFKSRLQNTSGGGASAYSKPKKITVS